jgi:hypothetical protein
MMLRGHFQIKYSMPNMTLETSKINFTNQFLCSFSFLIASSEFLSSLAKGYDSAKGGEKGDPNRNPWLAKMPNFIGH